MNNTQSIRRFASQTHTCAMQMMENATYIQQELPRLKMPDSLRQQIAELCSDLIGTKHDLIHEIYELDGFLVSAIFQVEPCVERIRRWIMEQMASVDQCVQAVIEAVDRGTADGSISILLMESASNILNEVPAIPDIEDASAIAEQDEDEDDPNCYAFHCEDSYPIGLLIAAIRRLMVRPDIPTGTADQLKVFLFAMERLPLVTPGVRMSLGLRLDQGGESDWIEIRIEDDVFSLSRGSWIEGDAHTETAFEVDCGYRDGDAFTATHFAESFLRCAEDVCREFVVEDDSDEPFTDWGLGRDKSLWASLPGGFL